MSKTRDKPTEGAVFQAPRGWLRRGQVRLERADRLLDESRRGEDQCKCQTWDENDERCFEIKRGSLSGKESERGDDEQVSGNGQRVKSAR
jgi:hypothetical protein